MFFPLNIGFKKSRECVRVNDLTGQLSRCSNRDNPYQECTDECEAYKIGKTREQHIALRYNKSYYENEQCFNQ
jgi:hypothetical protein